MNIIEKITAQGYEIRECTNEYTGEPNGFIEIRRKNKPWRTVPKTNDKAMYFVGGRTVRSTAEAKRLVAEGSAYKSTTNEIYAAFFHQNEDEQCKFRYGYGLKSRRYIESVMQEIGLISIEEGTDFGGMKTSLPDEAEEIPYAINGSTYIGMVEEGRWLVESYLQYIGDDFAIIKMWFNHKPTDTELRYAFAIRSIEIELRNKPEKFRCWECGRTTHWVDVEGNIEDKLRKYEDKYCGC